MITKVRYASGKNLILDPAKDAATNLLGIFMNLTKTSHTCSWILETFFFQDFAGKLSYNHTREEISMDYARKIYHKILQNKLLCDHTRCALKFISDLFSKIIQEILCRSYSQILIDFSLMNLQNKPSV